MTNLFFAANNAEIGGGEVMLLRYAQVCQKLGHDVTVVAPQSDTGVGQEAARLGFSTVGIAARSKSEYMKNLRLWDATKRDGVLWCHGHTPGLATVGHPHRIVHLHQAPTKKHVYAGRIAGAGALALVVPSVFMKKKFPFAQYLPNWCDEIHADARPPFDPHSATIGFLGRLSPIKGIDILAQSIAIINDNSDYQLKLLVAGEPRFSSPKEQARVESSLDLIRDHLIMAGWMDRQDFFNSCDIAVFPSTVEESFGLTVCEAMATKIPFIISNAGALPEVAGINYPWICRSSDPNSTAHLVRLILSSEFQTISQTIDSSWNRWRQFYSPESAEERIRNFITDVIPPVEDIQ